MNVNLEERSNSFFEELHDDDFIRKLEDFKSP